ncbi:MAG: VanW family protein [Schwartzia sp.]|nr:VanW family protein [Schwartzia sp. (in: firmicutes)]
MKPRNLIIIFTALCLLVALLLSISFFSLIFGFVSQDRIAFGLRFDDQPLTGLTKSEAQHMFEKKAEAVIPDVPVVLTDGAKLYPIKRAAIALNADTDAALEKAYSAGRIGSRLEQITDALDCAIRGRTITLKGIWDEEKLQHELKKITASIERQPIEGCVWLEPTGIHHRPPAAGLHVDTEALDEELAPKLTELCVPHTFQLPIETIPPKVPAEAFASIDAVLSEYSTFYNPSSNRGENIAIAASKLNQVIIQPGEEFSFNGTVGGRVVSAGYLDAPVIIDGKVEQDIGGGVCQVSSTLYNAVLLAGLTPTMRTSHFYPSDYVPAGLDATVADGQIDFCFRNDLPHSVYLLAGASGGTLTVTVLGSSQDARSYGLTTEITGPNPTVDVYRVTYENGAVIDSEYLHTDNYDIPQENNAH